MSEAKEEREALIALALKVGMKELMALEVPALVMEEMPEVMLVLEVLVVLVVKQKGLLILELAQ